MTNPAGRGHHGIFSRKLDESERIPPNLVNSSSELGRQQVQPVSEDNGSWDGLWGDNVYNRDEFGRRRKKRSQKTVKLGKVINLFPKNMEFSTFTQLGQCLDRCPLTGRKKEGMSWRVRI